MNRLIILFLILSSIIFASKRDLTLGKNYFKIGKYKKTISIFNKLILELDLERDKIEVYKILGASYYFNKNYESSKKSFIEMLGISPNETLDPLLYPPPLIEYFSRINEEFKKKNKEIKKVVEKKKEEHITKNVNWKYETKEVVLLEKNPFITQFIPFGYAQYRNHEKSKAYILLTSESILLATNIITYWLSRSLADSNGYYNSRFNEAKIYQKIQIVSLITLGGVILYGGIDGMLNYKPVFKKTVTVINKKPLKISFFQNSKNFVNLTYKF